MTEKLVKQLSSLSDADGLMDALYAALDYVYCYEIEINTVRRLCEVAVNRINEFEDREDALHFVSTCASRIETTHGIDLTPLVSLIPTGSVNELINIINVLANSDDRSYLNVIKELTNQRHVEVVQEARIACEELDQRTNAK